MQEGVALISHLTCYMWQQGPCETSNRLCVLCIRGLNTCSVSLTAVFVCVNVHVCEGSQIN